MARMAIRDITNPNTTNANPRLFNCFVIMMLVSIFPPRKQVAGPLSLLLPLGPATFAMKIAYCFRINTSPPTAMPSRPIVTPPSGTEPPPPPPDP